MHYLSFILLTFSCLFSVFVAAPSGFQAFYASGSASRAYLNWKARGTPTQRIEVEKILLVEESAGQLTAESDLREPVYLLIVGKRTALDGQRWDVRPSTKVSHVYTSNPEPGDMLLAPVYLSRYGDKSKYKLRGQKIGTISEGDESTDRTEGIGPMNQGAHMRASLEPIVGVFHWVIGMRVA